MWFNYTSGKPISVSHTQLMIISYRAWHTTLSKLTIPSQRSHSSFRFYLGSKVLFGLNYLNRTFDSDRSCIFPIKVKLFAIRPTLARGSDLNQAQNLLFGGDWRSRQFRLCVPQPIYNWFCSLKATQLGINNVTEVLVTLITHPVGLCKKPLRARFSAFSDPPIDTEWFYNPACTIELFLIMSLSRLIHEHNHNRYTRLFILHSLYEPTFFLYCFDSL